MHQERVYYTKVFIDRNGGLSWKKKIKVPMNIQENMEMS